MSRFLPLKDEAQKAIEKVVEKKVRTVREIYNTLFDESFKAYVLVLLQLHEREVCTWNDLFEGSGLKGLGASTGTVANVIKVLEEGGVVQREKAPFPFKTKYRLVVRDPPIDALSYLLNEILNKIDSPEQYRWLVVERWPRIAEYFLWVIVKYFAEGNGAHAAIVGFMLLDYLYHLVANMPEQLQSEVLTGLKRITEEAPELKPLKEILAKST